MTFKQIIYRLNRRNLPLLPKFSTSLKIFLVVLMSLITIITTKTIFAQTETIINPVKEKQDAIIKGNNQEAWLDSALSSNLVSVLNSLVGGIPFNRDGSVNSSGYVPQGALGATNRMVSSLFNQPVSGVLYLAEVKDNFLGKPVYAQTTGFKGLQPILPLWRTFRNIVYVLISIVFVVLGIMIMLRIKISPQATVTIQNSIPKIITTLILVTFSYAIAGLIIDLSKIVLAIGLSVFFEPGATDTNLFNTKINTESGIPIISALGDAVYAALEAIGSGLFNINPTNHTALTNMSFGTIYDLANRAIPGAAGFALGEITGQIFLGVLLGGVGGMFLGRLGSSVTGAIGSVAGDVLGGIAGWILLPIIFAIMMVIWMIKLYFGLLKNYIMIILKIIIAPIQIGMGAFPSAKSGFSSWLIDIIANISVFPIVSIFVVALNYLTDRLTEDGLWIPSQIELNTFSGNIAVVSAGIGLAGIAMISKLPKLVPEAIFKLKASPFGSAIGESFKPLKTIGGMGTSAAATGYTRRYGDPSDNYKTFDTSKGGTLANIGFNLVRKFQKK